MSSGYIAIPHTCPKCGKTANSHKEVEGKFGYRNIGDGKIRVQSQCKVCR